MTIKVARKEKRNAMDDLTRKMRVWERNNSVALLEMCS